MPFRITSFEEYQEEYKKSVQDPETFWAEKAEEFSWKKKWDKVLDWEFKTPDINWFVNGKLNITENCLEQNMKELGDRPAIIWEPNDPADDNRIISYAELYDDVCRFGNVLKNLGVEKGDRVCLYMPMVPELAIAILACARIGAIHSVVFAGFSASSLADRVNDAEAKVVLCSDGGYRGNKNTPIKSIVDDALESCPTVKNVVVFRRTAENVNMKEGRDLLWQEEVKKVSSDCPAEEMDSEDPLFILYTSGSTGRPKGIVHTTGGYMVYARYSFENVFQYDKGDVYWCTADIGWITGHTYIVYGPLLAGATSVMFEGVPTYPDASRFWQVIEKYKVNQFYTAPTAIRALMAAGVDKVEPYKMESLKVLGSVGEPINEEAWHWYHDEVGKGRCPIVDTWWQTETGGILISPLAGITKEKPSFATLPLPGVQPVIVDAEGNVKEENNVEGNLCIRFPWPGMLRTTYGDHERCRQTYFATYNDKYFTGDECKRNEDGYFRILGRVDDVINVSGHRIGTAEVENAIDEHKKIVEGAVVGYPHDIKGQGIYAFVIPDETVADEDKLRKEILEEVTRVIGPIAKPDKIQFVKGLPKTRSGKIMRRVLRKIAAGNVEDFGDTSTLEEPEVIEDIINGRLSN